MPLIGLCWYGIVLGFAGCALFFCASIFVGNNKPRSNAKLALVAISLTFASGFVLSFMMAIYLIFIEPYQ